jgi:uncharacterized RDD family membrane protein YckC
MQFESPDMISPAMYASMSRRLGAWIIDIVILGVLGVVAGHIIPVLGGIAIWFFYAPILEASAIRATLGKHLMGIQVADLSGRRVSFRAALIRNVMKIVSTAILFIGYIFALFSSRKQTLHDILAETTVVYGRSEVSIADAWVEETKALFRAGEGAVGTAGVGANTASSSNTEATAKGSVADELERLQALFYKGTLTAEEFEAAKKKILS